MAQLDKRLARSVTMVMNPAALRRCRRILVVGAGGAGKTTLSLRLGTVLGLPVVHLDREYWRPGWVATPDDEWRARVAELTARPEWVMDGNYSGTFAERLASADAVLFLDLPRLVCLAGVVLRHLRYRRGDTRPDVTAGCPEKLDGQFLRWIWTYPTRSRPRVLSLLDGTDKVVMRLGSRTAIARLLAALEVGS